MPNLIQVTDQEWEAAKAFFDAEDERVAANAENQEPAAVKFKARDKAIHSFIRVGGEIFAMETKGFASHLLGEGAFGKVRMVQTENGENFAVKIEGRGLRGENNAETKIMKILNYIKGEAVEHFKSNKQFKEKSTNQKLYTVTQLRKGDELYKEIYFDYQRKKLTPIEKLNIALNACKAIQILHDHNIVHADIKPQNFMANREGEEIMIESIDYGFSLIVLPPVTKIQINKAKGTPLYMAPEIHQGIYSFSSDVYALGIMLSQDLLLKDSSNIGQLIKKMCDPNPDLRPTLDTVIHAFTLAQAQEIIFISKLPERTLEFTNKWNETSLREQYRVENRNIMPKINPFLYLFKKVHKISDTRKTQLRLLSDAIAMLHSDNKVDKSNSILNVCSTIGYIQAQLKNESNWLGSRLSKTLDKIEKDLNKIYTPSPLTKSEIIQAKEEGAAICNAELPNPKKRSKKKRPYP